MVVVIDPTYDPTLSPWVAEVCPDDLRPYYCVHGKYIGAGDVFPCNRCHTYQVEVDWSTHDLLKEGWPVVGTSGVKVWADDEDEAALVAAQLVASSIKFLDGKKALVMPTGARVVL